MNMSEKLYIRKSKKLEKIDSAMMQLIDELGGIGRVNKNYHLE